MEKEKAFKNINNLNSHIGYDETASELVSALMKRENKGKKKIEVSLKNGDKVVFNKIKFPAYNHEIRNKSTSILENFLEFIGL